MIPDDELPHIVMGACMEVHRQLGPGWEAHAYRAALAQELRLKEMFFKLEVPIPITNKGERIPTAARADFLIEERLLVMVHACPALDPIHKAQLTSFLRQSGLPSGFVINFNVTDLRQGVKRVVIRDGSETTDEPRTP